MERQLTKIFTPLLIALIATSFFGALQTPVTNQTATAQELLTPKPPTGSTIPPLDPSQTTATREMAMNIIQNVIQADSSKYNIELKDNSIMDGIPLSNINRKITNLLYALTPLIGNDIELPLNNTGTFHTDPLTPLTGNGEDSVIEIVFSFEKDALTSYLITPIDSQVITTTHYSNRHDAIANFLEKYQQTTNIDSSNLLTTLNKVNLSKNSTTTQENTKLDVLVSTFWGTEQTQLKWTHTVNGADYTRLEISVNTKGNVISVFDTRALYTIGDTSINISKEQAIDIAIENLKDYSYDMYDGTVVTDFKVSRSNVVAKLVTSPVDYTLKPYWDVRMMLDEVYPGNVHGIAVGIWANTGEFSAYSNMAYGETVDLDNNNPADPKPTSPNYTLIAAAATAVVAAIAIVTVGLIIKKVTNKLKFDGYTKRSY